VNLHRVVKFHRVFEQSSKIFQMNRHRFVFQLLVLNRSIEVELLHQPNSVHVRDIVEYFLQKKNITNQSLKTKRKIITNK